MSIKIPVKEIAYFVHASGDLTNEFFSNRDMNEGAVAHKYLQKLYNKDSIAEMFVKHEVSFKGRDIIVDGYIDGVLNDDGKIIIEEIKSTAKDLDTIDGEYHKEHLAQLKLYSYMYAVSHEYTTINSRLTYISVVDYQTKSFDYKFDVDDLEDFFFSSLEKYLEFFDLIEANNNDKDKTIKEVEFPFKNLRPGQRDLMNGTYYALSHKEILYAIAPTGIGKTMATIFSGLKSLHDPHEKIFYLTAKGLGKKVAVDSLKLLKSKGLKMKSIDITAKGKCCNAGKSHCDPEKCIYAKKYFDRLQEATVDIYKNEDIFDDDAIKKYSEKYQICAFEFSLYLSYYCDFIIADYNYVFDPRAHLIRYFEDDTYKPKLLVDEAHNLISRSRDMYSAVASTADFRNLRKNLNGIKPSVRNDINKILVLIEKYQDYLTDTNDYFTSSLDHDLYVSVKNLCAKCEQIFTEQKEFKNRDQAIENYFVIKDFKDISEYFSESHRFIVKKLDDEVEVQLLCLDASKFIYDRINEDCYGTVFFSATLYPMQYHMDMLTKGIGNFMELKSSFPYENLDLIINDKVSTKYKDRDQSIDSIIETIDTLVESKVGNYIVFFPSYSYMNKVINSIDDRDYEIIVQKSSMTDKERTDVFNKFLDSLTSKVGFFVLGGVFAEGIDFTGDLLSGVLIVGVGLPQVCLENNLAKEYFDDLYENGFDYAYTYPGFNRVVQAAGRVIRTETDRGVVILMDERYKYVLYQSLMPEHWAYRKHITSNYYLRKELEEFFRK